MAGTDHTETVEGRERYPVQVRDFRSVPEALARVLVPTSGGTQILLEQVADIHFETGPRMIRSENGQLAARVEDDEIPRHPEVVHE